MYMHSVYLYIIYLCMFFLIFEWIKSYLYVFIGYSVIFYSIHSMWNNEIEAVVMSVYFQVKIFNCIYCFQFFISFFNIVKQFYFLFCKMIIPLKCLDLLLHRGRMEKTKSVCLINGTPNNVCLCGGEN